jgi:two-component system OmpR family sensor kinase
LSLYLFLVVAVLILLGLFYYENQKKFMLSNQRGVLSAYAYEQTRRLKILHHYFDDMHTFTYPRDSRFKSAIYDLEEVKIFSILTHEDVRFNEEIYQSKGKIYYVYILDIHYLGAKYLIIEVDEDRSWYRETLNKIILYGWSAFVILALFGLMLARLFVKPMRDSIMLLDRFIKDTTHELNTPLSAILANIEMMDTAELGEKNKKRLDRMTIAAKTVSTLYEDLTYLTLEHERGNHNESLDLRKIIQERVEYFDTSAKSKQITFDLNLDDEHYVMDSRKFIRVIDNLISNAIKYNRRGGTVAISLEKGKMTIEDSGIGIKEDKIPFIFDRYMRFNSSEGGFGVGLSIVKKILDEYKIKITVDSQEGKGTRLVLKW